MAGALLGLSPDIQIATLDMHYNPIIIGFRNEEDIPVEHIYPITALSKQQQMVKEAAREDIVRITEHGMAAWIFASEEVFERRIREAVEEALYEAKLDEAIAKGLDDIKNGRYVVGVDAARKYVEELRKGMQ